MKLKKIDTTSTKYGAVRFGLKLFAGLGGIVVTESVAIPFVCSVWKSKTMRALGFLGTIGLSMHSQVIAETGMDIYADAVVNTYNTFCDMVNKDNKSDSDDASTQEIEPDTAIYTPASKTPSFDDIDKWIVTTDLFSFDTEEEAKNVITTFIPYAREHGWATIRDFYEARNVDKVGAFEPPMPGSEFVGWTWDDIMKHGVEIDDMSDGGKRGPYVLSLSLYYRDISDMYEVIDPKTFEEV